MRNVNESVRYLQGLLDGLKDAPLSDRKFAEAVVGSLGEVARAITELQESATELDDYLGSIDDDLAELESRYGQESGDEDYEDLDSQDADDAPEEAPPAPRGNIRRFPHAAAAKTESLTLCLCPECGGLFAAPFQPQSKAVGVCPYCHREIVPRNANPDQFPRLAPKE